MALFTLVYRYIDDEDTVTKHRPHHRAYLTTLKEKGQLLASGPLGAPGPAGGLLIFDLRTAAELEDIVAHDPFKKVGVISDYTIQSWSIFIGPELFAKA